ncbi:ATP-dependent DNA helicase PIF1-like protein [Tanacetum coccineum]
MPSPTNDPEGYKVVIEFMLHDPCGKGAVCTVDGKCSKKYPKPFYPETKLDEDGYPDYRHRDSKLQAIKGKFTYDNKYVVPYNHLLIKYQAHINVEWCNRSKAIKYLFKYLNKGPDRVIFVIQENVHNGPLGELQKVESVDEIKNYLNYQYLAPCEAKLYPTFKAVCFAYGLLNDDKEWAHAINEASFWALAPQLRDLFVTMLLFCDVSRPLRLWEETWELLSNRRSLADFQEPPRLNPALLTKLMAIEGMGRNLGNFYRMIFSLRSKLGVLSGTSRNSLGQNPAMALFTKLDNWLIREAMDFDIKQSKLKHDQLHSLLNPKQHAIYKDVIQFVHNQSGQFYFVYGPGGTGKTFVYKTIISQIRSEGMIVLAVASSGIASLLLPGGRTAHSRFVIPLELVENSTCGIKQNTHLAELLQEVQLII